MSVKAQVIASGNATAVEIPKSAVDQLNGGARPAIVVTIHGHSWRTRVALKNGLCLVGISAANRAAAGIAEGDTVLVSIALDTAPRDVEEPMDLKRALDAQPQCRAAFGRLAFGLRAKRVRELEEAKSPETRQRRLDKLMADLGKPGA